MTWSHPMWNPRNPTHRSRHPSTWPASTRTNSSLTNTWKGLPTQQLTAMDKPPLPGHQSHSSRGSLNLRRSQVRSYRTQKVDCSPRSSRKNWLHQNRSQIPTSSAETRNIQARRLPCSMQPVPLPSGKRPTLTRQTSIKAIWCTTCWAPRRTISLPRPWTQTTCSTRVPYPSSSTTSPTSQPTTLISPPWPTWYRKSKAPEPRMERPTQQPPSSRSISKGTTRPMHSPQTTKAISRRRIPARWQSARKCWPTYTTRTQNRPHETKEGYPTCRVPSQTKNQVIRENCLQRT